MLLEDVVRVGPVLLSLLALLDLRVELLAGPEGERDEEHADEAGDPVRDLQVDREDHAGGQGADGVVRTVLQVPVLGERAGPDQVDRHGTHEQGADAEAERDQDDHVGDGERAADPVERERRVLDLQVHECPECRPAGLLGGVVVLFERELCLGVVLVLAVLLFALEHRGEEADDHVQQDAGHAPREDLLLFVGGRGDGDDVDDRRGDEQRRDVQLAGLADAGQRTLDPRDPLDLPLLQDEVEEDQQQEHAAEDGDGRVRDLQLLGVEVRVVQRQVPDVAEAHLGGQHDDDDREQEPHADDGDRDADGHEDQLPLGAHVLQDRRVDDRVVEGEGDLQDDQDRQLEGRQPPEEVERSDDGQGGRQEVPLVVLEQGLHDGSFQRAIAG